MVVKVDDQKVLLAAVDGQVYAVNNKCSHLGLPLVGKTALLQGEVSNGCITCPAHGTKFDLKDGSVQSEWCPKLPSLPLVGKIGNKETPLTSYTVAIDKSSGAVSVDL